MSKLPFHHYESPTSNSSKLFVNHDVSLLHLNSIRPTSSKADQKYLPAPILQNYHQYPRPSVNQMNERLRDVSPTRLMMMKNREIYEQSPNSYLIHKSQSYSMAGDPYAYSPQYNRDISPLTRLIKMNEIQQTPQHLQRDYIRNERDSSWDKLMRRPEQDKMQKIEKMSHWKKELEVQMAQQKAKKQLEQEVEKNKQIQEEYKYRKQIEELAKKNYRSTEQRPIKNSGNALSTRVIIKKQESPLRGSEKTRISEHYPLDNDAIPQASVFVKKDFLYSPTYDPRLTGENRGKSLQKYGEGPHLDQDDDRPRQRINVFIDNLKAEILNGQKYFMDQMKDLNTNDKRTGRFRNLAERNILGAQRVGFVKAVGVRMTDPIGYDESFSESQNSQVIRHRLQKQVQFHETPSDLSKMIEIDGKDKIKKDADIFYDELTKLSQGPEKLQTKNEVIKQNVVKEVKKESEEVFESKLKKKQVEEKAEKKSKEKMILETNVKPEIKIVEEKKEEKKEGLKKESITLIPETKKEIKEGKNEDEKDIKKSSEIKEIQKEEKEANGVMDKKEKLIEKKIEHIKESFPVLLTQLEEELLSQNSNTTERKDKKIEIPEKDSKQAKVSEEKQSNPKPGKSNEQAKPEKLQENQQKQQTLQKPIGESVQSLNEMNPKANSIVFTQEAHPNNLRDFLELTTKPSAEALSERTITQSDPSKRGETPLEHRKIQNFNVFKDSRRGSVDTVNLDLFEDLLAKEVIRGKAPTFKSTKIPDEVMFEGFSYTTNRKNLANDRRKKNKKITLKSEVTLNALAQIMKNDEEIETKIQGKKSKDPIGKLDFMIDHLFN